MDFDYMHMVGGKKPAGTKHISITANGEFTENISGYEYADVIVNVPVDGSNVINDILEGSISGDFYNSDISSLNNYSLYGTKISYISLQNCVSVGISSFSNCENLISVNLPNVKNFEYSVFSECKSLESVYAPMLEYTNYYAFNNCSKLKSVEFNNLGYINRYVFNGCTSLTKCIARSAISIENQAFNGCTSLDVVDILGSASGSISTYAFYNSKNLKSLIIRSNEGVIALGSSSGLDACTNLTVYVPDELVDSYKAATNWSVIADRIRPISEYVEEV